MPFRSGGQTQGERRLHRRLAVRRGKAVASRAEALILRSGRMPPTSRKPLDLAPWMSQRLTRANVQHRAGADALFVWAAWSLDSGQLGLDVLQLARPNGDQNLTGHQLQMVEMAAMNLVFRGVVSAMDQLAAAVFRLTGEPIRPDRERDVGWWFKTGQKPWHLVPAPLEDWLRPSTEAQRGHS